MDPLELAALAGYSRTILTGVIGLVGIGTGAGVLLKRSKGQFQRNFSIKKAILCLVFSGIDLVSSMLIPIWYNILLVIPYIFVVAYLMGESNKITIQIQNEQGRIDGAINHASTCNDCSQSNCPKVFTAALG